MKFSLPFKDFQSIADYKKVDLSKSHLEKIKVNILDNTSLSNYLESLIKDENGHILYGGYLEERALYNDKSHFQSGNKQRNIHLGIDFWAKEGTLVVAPLDGIVHSFANNANKGNYGPTVILKHNIGVDTFYSLYGHLSLDSLNNIKIGQTIRQGSIFAKLGEEKINVGYVPHLHFQLIKDLEGYSGDYPGVCHKDDLEFYTANTINPNTYFNLN
jgi:murein DD-endopeptidase MepM/ murein hydrolase activator NlpD